MDSAFARRVLLLAAFGAALVVAFDYSLNQAPHTDYELRALKAIFSWGIIGSAMTYLTLMQLPPRWLVRIEWFSLGMFTVAPVLWMVILNRMVE